MNDEHNTVEGEWGPQTMPANGVDFGWYTGERPEDGSGKGHCIMRSNVLLVDENSCCDLLDTFGIGDGVDLDDLAIDDQEAHNIDGLSIYRDYYSGCPVHQGRVQTSGRAREPSLQPAECLPCDSLGAVHHHGRCVAARTGVDAQHDVGVEHGNEGVEVATSRSREEGVSHCSLTS